MKSDEIVITSLGIVSPIGCGEQAFWESLRLGRSGAAPVDGLDTSELSRRIACQVRDPIDVRPELGRASQLAVAAAKQAISSAGLDRTDFDSARVSVTVGTTMGETEFIEERLDAPDSDWLSADHIQRIAAGRSGSLSRNVQSELGIRGSAMDIYGACAAGNMALETARRHLLDDQCDIAIAGGADGFSRLAFIGFMRLRVMAAEQCRPFDDKRDGLLVGEGATMFVLERASSARARGAPIRARLIGGAITCETYHPTRPHPDGDGLTRATREAMRDADLQPADIDYVCAHGTGTPHNDAVEMKVMANCFPGGTPFSSIKALTGHTMGAAAAMEAAACILSLEHQTLIPTWNLDNVLQPCPLDALQGAVRRARLRCVVNNSAGFGGYNSAVVLAAP